MKKITTSLMVLSTIALFSKVSAQAIPKFDHVVFIIEENYAYSEVIGSKYAPTLTWLSQQPYCVNFTQAFAELHPSEPNYLILFSGDNQGVTTDEVGPDNNAPFDNCNLCSSLYHKKLTFTGYAEDQPAVGTYLTGSGNYDTKHSPWINWITTLGGTKDTCPAASDIPYSYANGYSSGPIFPDSNHYSTLPTVAWVIPNEIDNMHNGSESSAIPAGDSWFKTNMMPLVRWATIAGNKTLVIVIWDEDDSKNGNNIPCLFSSSTAWIKGGNNSTKFYQYDVLRTIEDMYGLTVCTSKTYTPTSDVPNTIWVTTDINSVSKPSCEVNAWPVPAKEQLNLHIKLSVVSGQSSVIDIYDMTSRLVKEIPFELKNGDTYLTIPTGDIANGVYFLNLKGENLNITKKIVVQK